jgi:hypothetical protein
MTGNIVDQARATICDRIGANIYGRTAEFIRKAESGDDKGARRELLALLKFFPTSSTDKQP